MKRLTKSLVEETLQPLLKEGEKLLECGWALKGFMGVLLRWADRRKNNPPEGFRLVLQAEGSAVH